METTSTSGPERIVPRSYQLELFEKAKEQNIVAFIDTGGGKTLVASLLIEFVLTRTVDSPKLCIFIVNNRPLGLQQFAALRAQLPENVKIGNYSGISGLGSSEHHRIDHWDKEKWQHEFSSQDVLVMTADLLLNNLRHAFITMQAIGLLVFDECHHAKKSSPMSLIMKEFYHPILYFGRDAPVRVQEATRGADGNVDGYEAFMPIARVADTEGGSNRSEQSTPVGESIYDSDLSDSPTNIETSHVADTVPNKTISLSNTTFHSEMENTTMTPKETPLSGSPDAICSMVPSSNSSIQLLDTAVPDVVATATIIGTGTGTGTGVSNKRLLPKILGLTASPIHSGLKSITSNAQIRKMSNELEFVLDAVIVQANREEVAKYVSHPVEVTRYFRPVKRREQHRADFIMKKMEKLLQKLTIVKQQGELRRYFCSIMNIMDQLGAWCAVQYIILVLNTLKKQIIALREKENSEEDVVLKKTMFKYIRTTVRIFQEEYFPRSVEAIPASEAAPDSNLTNDEVSVARLVWRPSRLHIDDTVAEDNDHDNKPAADENADAGDEDEADVEGDILEAYHIPSRPTNRDQLSSQLSDLLALLRELQHEQGNLCAIIFVQRRSTASLLSHVINAIFGTGLTVNPTDGSDGGSGGGDGSETGVAINSIEDINSRASVSVIKANVSTEVTSNQPATRAASQYNGLIALPLTGAQDRSNNIVPTSKSGLQRDVLAKFRSGEVNILVATSVAEEGLDIPSCKVVIRFNPLVSLVSYLQSRGRARHVDSKYIIMTERYGSETASQMQFYEAQMRGEMTEDIATSVAQKMLRDNCSQEVDDFLSEAKGIAATEYRVPSTGAKVTLSSAVSLLHSYCQYLPKDKYMSTVPIFDYECVGGGVFTCQVYLPTNCAVQQCFSGPQSSKRLAKQMVCLNVIRKLHVLRALNDHFTPSAWFERLNLMHVEDEFHLGKIELPELSSSSSSSVEEGGLIIPKDTVMALREVLDLLPTVAPSIKKYDAKLVAWSPQPWEEFHEPILLHSYLMQSITDPTMRLLLLSVIPVVDNYECSYVLEGKFHQISLKFIGCKMFSKSELQSLQRYYCILLSGLLPSTFISKLLELPITYSPMILAPVQSTDITMQRSDSDFQDYDEIEISPWRVNRIIDWNEINRIVFLMASGLHEYNAFKLLNIHERDLAIFEKELQSKLLVSINRRVTDGGWNYRRMVGVRVIEKLNPATMALKRIYKANVNQSTIVESEKTQRVLADVLANRSRSIDNYANQTVVVATTAPSVRSIKPFHVIQQSAQSASQSQKRGNGDDEDETVMLIKLDALAGRQLLAETGDENGLPPDYLLQSSQRLENLADFVVPLPSLLIHPIDIAQITASLGSVLVLHTVEQLLVAERFRNTLLPRMTDLSLMLAALSTPSAQLDDNYERYETLGDIVLKLLITMHVMVCEPHQHEGQLTVTKTTMIRNSYLFRCAADLNLAQYIISEPFQPRKYLPLGIDDVAVTAEQASTVTEAVLDDVAVVSVGGGTPAATIATDSTVAATANTMKTNRMRSRTLADKTVADVIEAIIGAYYINQNYDLRAAWSDLLAGVLNIVPKDSPFPIHSGEFQQQSNIQSLSESNQLLIASLLRITGSSTCACPQLWLDAVTHPTYKHASHLISSPNPAVSQTSRMHCYQRLEFLGDAVIDMVVMQYLFSWKLALTPGELSDWKSLTVCNESLAAVSCQIGLANHIRYDNPRLQCDIKKYQDYFQSNIQQLNQESFAKCLLLSSNTDVDPDTDDIEIINNRSNPPPISSSSNSSATGSIPLVTVSTAATASTVVAAPKALSDILEAIVGALFIENGARLDGIVTEFVHKNIIAVVLQPLLEQSSTYRWGPHRHRVSVVTEIKMAVYCIDHWTVFSSKNAEGRITCTYVVHGQQLACGSGTTKKTAEVAAAAQLLSESANWVTLTCGNCEIDAAEKREEQSNAEDSQSTEDGGPNKYYNFLKSFCTCKQQQQQR